MTEPNPLQYQSQLAVQNDISHLKILSILHYIWGGICMAFSCIFIIYIVIGALMASGNFGTVNANVVHGAANQPPPAVGYVLIGFGSCAVIIGWAIGILTIVSGRKMAARKSRIFSIVMGGVNCISFPIGTALGVFTIVVLSRSSVKALYESGPFQ